VVFVVLGIFRFFFMRDFVEPLG